jgi:serine/threonine protein phosphatase 1
VIYVSSDWHGVELYKIKRLLEMVNFSDDDFLFILGDIIDRGMHGVELIKYIMFEPNIKLIRGNHEQMMLDCSFLFEEITDDSVKAFNANKLRALKNWQCNGGDATIRGLAAESIESRQMILEFIEDTPLYDSVSVGGNDFLLVHAGLSLDTYGRLVKLSECIPEDLLWTRPRPNTKYSQDFMTILGHTPTSYFGKEYDGRFFKNDTWIDIDVGAAYGFSPAILRLDDMAEFYQD